MKIFTADWHLTDKPQDEYRWGIFPWLIKQVRKHDVDTIIIGGDLTDAKDKHSSVLVNRLAKELARLAEEVKVVVLKGNHDYIDEGTPFFDFTNFLERVMFLKEPWESGNVLFLPNTRDYRSAWSEFDFRKYDTIFCHQTFDGCESESGYRLDGIPPSFFKGARKVWSGDIHKPQKVGDNIEYVGAPYRIRFGDAFVPRLVLLDDKGKHKDDLHFLCQRKHLVEIVNPKSPRDAVDSFMDVTETGGLRILKGDQVKLRVKLPRSHYGEWPDIKADLIMVAKTDELQLTGPELIAMEEPKAKSASRAKDTGQDAHSPAEALEAYVEAKDLGDDLYASGREFLQQAFNALRTSSR